MLENIRNNELLISGLCICEGLVVSIITPLTSLLFSLPRPQEARSEHHQAGAGEPHGGPARQVQEDVLPGGQAAQQVRVVLIMLLCFAMLSMAMKC